VDYDVLAASVNQQLFFAGEHTSRYYRGAAHGAYESGIRAAKEIIELL
jgi:lysine-specific histone demethylase 1